MKHPFLIATGGLAALLISFSLGKMNSIGTASPPTPAASQQVSSPSSPLETQGWKLQADNSHLTITSVKKGTAGEVHHFKNLAGTIDKKGKARIEITLASIETRIPIRNKRMKKLLFEIADFPLAVITADLDMTKYAKLKTGQRIRDNITFSLDLHGVQKEMKADIFIDVLSGKAVSISTAKPIIIRAEHFNLEKGVAALQAVAKLPSISRAVPVTFNLLFEGS